MKQCGVCQKPVEAAKHRLHEATCARMNYKCPKCGEVVPKSDREQHEEDVHTEKPDIACDLCPDFVSKVQSEVDKHKREACKNRPQIPVAAARPNHLPAQASGASLEKCPYCPMEFVAGDQLQNHVSYCGSKTKECPDCFSTV